MGAHLDTVVGRAKTASASPRAASRHPLRDLPRRAHWVLLRRVPSAVTRGVRVDVQSIFIPEQSDPVVDRYVFAYRITITNRSDETVQLKRRHWYITDDSGSVREVEGEGVVGEQPVLAPGDFHEYTSGAVIEAPTGRMRGTYQMHGDDGSIFHVEIPEFELSMPRTLH